MEKIIFTNPLTKFDESMLKSDLELVRKYGFSPAFIRRRVVFFQDGYRYALDAAQKRWGIRFAFYETGNEQVKRVFQSENLNSDGAAVWLAQMERDPNFGPALVQELLGVIETEKKLADEVPKLPLTTEGVRLALEMHFEWWVKFFELAFLWFSVDPLKEETDKKIREVWKGSTQELEYFLEHAYRPMKFPMSSVEQRDLLAISRLEGEELTSAIQLHTTKYQHLALHNIDDEYFDTEYYMGRVRLFQNPEEYAKQKELLDTADKELEEANVLLEKAILPEQLKQSIEFVRWFMYLRTESVDHFMLVNGAYKMVFGFLAKQFDLPIDAVLNMTYKEIADSLDSGSLAIPRETVLDRTKNGYGYFIGPEHSVLATGDDIEKLYNACFPDAKNEDVKELKGQVAFKGKVQAKARVIVDRRNAHELKEGEILVTTMTSPEFVPAMKISAGIITNEGGVLCHAAIMSRELRRPCVIGTKIATDVIKTGDVVELDAEEGIVKIL
jgi:phosphohistidine swiveling domain-containing protein